MAEELDIERVQARLKGWFERKILQAGELSLSPLQKPGMGLSNETFLFDLQWREAGERKREKLVIRWRPMRFVLFPKYDMKEQFLLMKHLENTGVPAPKARWLEEDESVIGTPFYIVDRIEGWIPGENPPYHVVGPLCEATPEYRAKIWWKAVDTMVKINTVDWEGAGLGFLGIPKGGTDPIDQHIAYYEKMLKMSEGAPPPILKATMDWLKKNRVVPKHVSLCWGDARLGNLIFRDDEVVGVLDWEMVLLGDHESDLLWFLHLDWILSGGGERPRLEGLPGREETVDYYQRVTDRKVENLFYHDVFATWRTAVIFNRLEVILRAIGYLLPDAPTINRANFEKLSSLLGL